MVRSIFSLTFDNVCSSVRLSKYKPFSSSGLVFILAVCTFQTPTQVPRRFFNIRCVALDAIIFRMSS